MSRIDPTGNFSLGDIFNSIGQTFKTLVNNIKEFVNPGPNPGATASDIVDNWWNEKGESDTQTFTEKDQVTRDLMKDEGVQEAKEAFKQNPDENTYDYDFGVNDYLRELATFDDTGSVLGSYTVQVKLNPDQSKTYTVTNTTGLTSGTRSPVPSAKHNASIEDMLNRNGKFTFNPKSIYNDRNRSEKGSGGNFNQIYTWREK